MRRMYDENEIKQIASETGGGGGGKLYMHDVTIKESGSGLPIVKFKYISSDNTEFTKFSLANFNFLRCFDVYANDNNMPPKFYGVKDIATSASSITITYYTTYPFDVTSTAQLPVQTADIDTNDNVFEL